MDLYFGDSIAQTPRPYPSSPLDPPPPPPGIHPFNDVRACSRTKSTPPLGTNPISPKPSTPKPSAPTVAERERAAPDPNFLRDLQEPQPWRAASLGLLGLLMFLLSLLLLSNTKTVYLLRTYIYIYIYIFFFFFFLGGGFWLLLLPFFFLLRVEFIGLMGFVTRLCTCILLLTWGFGVCTLFRFVFRGLWVYAIVRGV